MSVSPVTANIQRPPSEEKGLASAPLKYILTAAIISTAAVLLFSTSFLGSIALFAVAAWFLYSGSIIIANRLAEGTKLEKPIRILHSAAMEFNAMVKSAMLFPLTIFKSYHKAQGNLKGRPILMVNGYLSFGSTWHYQRKKLIKAGFGPIYTMNVGSGWSIEDYAKEVEKKVAQIQKETGRKDIILIGHSKGGLVSSYYATTLAQNKGTKVTDVVTIGSPLAGTPVAYLGPGRDAREMTSGSEFHKKLRDKISQAAHIRFFHIGSQTDEVVPLSSSLIGKDPKRQLQVKDTGHLGLVFSSRVADQTAAWLRPTQSEPAVYA